MINVAIIGCGGISAFNVYPLTRKFDDRAIITAVCDVYKHRRDNMAKELNAQYGEGTTRAYPDFREILERKDVDAVCICAHDNWHVPMSIAAAKAGKDIYCQKPLSISMEWSKILRQEVEKAKVIFQFGTQQRSWTPFRKTCELVRNGYIGELKEILVWCPDMSTQADRFRGKPYGSTEEVAVPDGLDYDGWQGPSDLVPYTVDRCTTYGGYHAPETSLGFIAGWGIHPLDIAQWGNRSDDTSPIKYEGTGSLPKEGIFRTVEQWDIHATYENGMPLRFMDFRTAKEPLKGFEHDGNHGTLFRGSKGYITVNRRGVKSDIPGIIKTELKKSDETLYVSREHTGNFLDCIKSRRKPVCTLEAAIRSDTICHMTDITVRTGRTINWDPEAETIKGDAEASKLLDRPARKKWKTW